MDKYILLHKDYAVAEFSTKRDTVLQAVINSWRKTHRLAYGMKAIYIFT